MLFFKIFYTSKIFILAAQLWKLNESRLENGYDDKWEFENLTWTLLSEGQKGCIKKSSSNLALTIEESRIILKDCDNQDEQMWVRGSPNKDGYFNLTNPGSNKYLTNHIKEVKRNTTTLEGE